MYVLLEYFNRALNINVWASVIRTIHLSEHFWGSDNQGFTVHNITLNFKLIKLCTFAL